MIIPPYKNGWSYDNSIGNWKLVYHDKIIVFHDQTDEAIATGGTLFVGTHKECEAQIAKEGLSCPIESEITT